MNSVMATGTGGGMGLILIYIVFFAALMYFMSYRPQKKQQKKHDEMMAGLTPGDTVLTSSGFYGTVIDITEDMVIVEFGNNKNCRIPMQKAVIVEVEKPVRVTEDKADNDSNKAKKG